MVRYSPFIKHPNTMVINYIVVNDGNSTWMCRFFFCSTVQLLPFGHLICKRWTIAVSCVRPHAHLLTCHLLFFFSLRRTPIHFAFITPPPHRSMQCMCPMAWLSYTIHSCVRGLMRMLKDVWLMGIVVWQQRRRVNHLCCPFRASSFVVII